MALGGMHSGQLSFLGEDPYRLAGLVLRSYKVVASSVLASQAMGVRQVSVTGIMAITLLMASPTSTIPVVYSVNYHQYPLMTAKCSIVSNITSIIFLPIWLIILDLI